MSEQVGTRLALVVAEMNAQLASAARTRLGKMTVAVSFILPLLMLPGAERPFSTPKLVFLGVAVCAGAVFSGYAGVLRRRELPIHFQIAFAGWLAVLGASASFAPVASLPDLLLPLLAAGWCLLIMLVRPRPEQLALAFALSGAVVAGVALLQFLGVNPFALGGWTPLITANPRMRVFATLGNPNFVAAFLVALMPLTYSLRTVFPRRRRVLSVVLIMDVLAVIATGSRATVLAFLAVVFWLTLLRHIRGWRWLLTAIGVAAAAVLVFAPARPVPVTFRGRAYIWQVAAPHLREHPLLGFGPGSFVAEYPDWEKVRWGVGDMLSSAKVFAGPEDHAHNDYLEFALENGISGLAGFLAVVATFLVFVLRRSHSSSENLTIGATAGIVVLLSIALVDFPFHRPAETFVFWTLLGIAYLHATNATAHPVETD
jgi:putative inorganic carbon (hco3(-)) transporter